MARAAVKAKQQARAKAQPVKPARGKRGHAGGGNPNQELFFMRLRRRQKWVFLALAIVFAATFVGVGVGSGSGGLSDLYSGLFGGSSDSVSKATSEIKTNPTKGYRDLMNAYIQKNDLPNAILAAQNYLKINKKDAGMWSQLGGLESEQANTYAGEYQAAQSAAQANDPAAGLLPTGPIGQQLGSNPVHDYYTQGSSQLSQLYQQATGAYATALGAYQKAAKIQPRNAQAQYQIYTAAVNATQYQVALDALKRYLQLDPSSPQKAQILSVEKQLEQALGKKPAASKSKSKK